MIAVGCIMVDNLIAIILFTCPFVATLLRPIIFACFLHHVRLNARHFYADLKDSASILIAIFVFITWYSLVGHFLFRYSFEGFNYFESVSMSFYNMLILMTTANFPDVMLPAYKNSYWVIIFFISFLVLGLYFLMNFLLANVYNKFTTRLHSQALQLYDDTKDMLTKMIDRFDYDQKGFLNWQESKEFFSVMFSLNLKKRKHFEALMELFDVMEIEDHECVMKGKIIRFFMHLDGLNVF